MTSKCQPANFAKINLDAWKTTAKAVQHGPDVFVTKSSAQKKNIEKYAIYAHVMSAPRNGSEFIRQVCRRINRHFLRSSYSFLYVT